MTPNDKDTGTPNPNKTELISVVDLHSVCPSPAPQVVGPPPTHPHTVPARPRPNAVMSPVRLSLPLAPSPAGQNADEPITLPGGQVDEQNEPAPPIPARNALTGTDDEEDTDNTGNVRRDLNPAGRKLPGTKRVVGAVAAIVGLIVAGVLVTMHLTGSKAAPTPTKPTATAPAAPTGDVGARALDLANRQGEAFNSFIAQVSKDLQDLDNRLAEAEKDKAALRKEVAELKQVVATLQQSAGSVEIGNEPDENSEPPPGVGSDDLVDERVQAGAPIDPTTVYKPQE